MPNYVANFEGLFVGVLRKVSCKVITFAIITTAVVGCRVTVVIAVFMDSCGVLGVRFPLSDFALCYYDINGRSSDLRRLVGRFLIQ
ncbi:hypothetical protein ARMGADRAFT_633548 [Armillaria gallica]|uniref:Uncharacterized protein n=1 Tax=Armillaria gallica TaxID=47427 RepID=A0A2H3ECN3_ARMGA|nr:hypothetical protein ARMGADRAFT_633548 [Armillaria gallica]